MSAGRQQLPLNGTDAAGSPGGGAAGARRGSVLVIGQEHTGGLASSLCNGFRDLGWDACHVKWGPWRPVLLSRLAVRASSMAEPFRYRLRRQVAVAARDRSFDAVVVVKGPFLDAGTISAIRRTTGAPLVCWNPDSPFDESMSNSGGNLAAAIPLYDAYVTWADDVAERLQARARRVAVIPFGFDPHMHFPEPPAGIADDRLVFIGTATADRQAWLSRLAEWEPVIFGNGWEPCPGLDVRPPVFGSEFRSVVGEARWNLNLLRPQNRTSHNMRTFEIPGCGGRQLAPMSADHERFRESTQAGLFADFDELTALLDSPPPAPSHDAAERLVHHSYRSRVALLVDHLHRGSW